MMLSRAPSCRATVPHEGVCFTSPSHSGRTKGTHRGLRRKSPPTKDSVDHKQGGPEYGCIGLDVEPPGGPTCPEIVAGQARNPARPQTQTLPADGIRREHEHIIIMHIHRINIREEEPS